jgi:hypothetical protein
MMLQFAMTCCVLAMTLASAYNNFHHMAGYGAGFVAAVIAAEIAKPMLPVALMRHVALGTYQGVVSAIACAVLWLIVVVFSMTNTLGNAFVQQAKLKASTQKEFSQGNHRPDYLILSDKANVQACIAPQQRTKDKQGRIITIAGQIDPQCDEKRKAKLASLDAELLRSKQQDTQGAAIDAHTVEDGINSLAAMGGVYFKRHEIAAVMVLIWVLLIELGSAFGGLAIPQRNKP